MVCPDAHGADSAAPARFAREARRAPQVPLASLGTHHKQIPNSGMPRVPTMGPTIKRDSPLEGALRAAENTPLQNALTQLKW